MRAFRKVATPPDSPIFYEYWLGQNKRTPVRKKTDPSQATRIKGVRLFSISKLGRQRLVRLFYRIPQRRGQVGGLHLLRGYAYSVLTSTAKIYC